MASSFFRFYLQKYMIVEEWLSIEKTNLARFTENYINYFDTEEVHSYNYPLKRSLSLP